MITNEQYQNAYDRNHFLLGLSLITVPAIFCLPNIMIGLLTACFLVWALWKEFYWDMDDSNETVEVSGGFWGGVRDFKFYAAGCALGWGMIAIKVMMSQKV